MPSFDKAVRIAFAAAIAVGATIAATGSADARPKKFKLMNSCSCACRQDDGGDTVYISNKDFYSIASCGSYNNTSCDVTVSTSEGTHQVTGTWEGCVDHGKVWVRVRAAASGDLPKLTVDPGVVEPEPGPLRDAVRPTEPPLTADPGAGEPPPPDPRGAATAPRETLEAAPADDTPD